MKAVGTRVPRPNAAAHVTGQLRFVDDVQVPNMLMAKAFRSPHHHARIVNLDTSKAEAVPGVRGVVTHADIPHLVLGHLEGAGIPADEPLLAKGEVRYKGQPIALVVAEDLDAARAGVEAIKADFEALPALFDIRLAFDQEAPTVHHWGNWYPHFEGENDKRMIRKGNIEAAFEQADRIIQGTYRGGGIEQMPMEPHVSVAIPEADGRLTVHSVTQAMYFSLGVIAGHLQVPLNRIQLIGGTVGGGFGSKVDTPTDTITAVAALKCGRPVKWRWTREEEFLVSSQRGCWHMEIIDAVSKDGWILGRKMLSLHDAGAYARFSPYGLTKHSFHHTGAYSIPNLHFDGYVVFTNRTPTSAMRGYGVTLLSYATETHLSRIAQEIGVDEYEMRLKNANRKGDTSPNRIAYYDPSTVSVVKALAMGADHELAPEYAAATGSDRTGDWLPDHLIGQLGTPEAH